MPPRKRPISEVDNAVQKYPEQKEADSAAAQEQQQQEEQQQQQEEEQRPADYDPSPEFPEDREDESEENAQDTSASHGTEGEEPPFKKVKPVYELKEPVMRIEDEPEGWAALPGGKLDEYLPSPNNKEDRQHFYRLLSDRDDLVITVGDPFKDSANTKHSVDVRFRNPLGPEYNFMYVNPPPMMVGGCNLGLGIPKDRMIRATDSLLVEERLRAISIQDGPYSTDMVMKIPGLVPMSRCFMDMVANTILNIRRTLVVYPDYMPEEKKRCSHLILKKVLKFHPDKYELRENPLVKAEVQKVLEKAKNSPHKPPAEILDPKAGLARKLEYIEESQTLSLPKQRSNLPPCQAFEKETNTELSITSDDYADGFIDYLDTNFVGDNRKFNTRFSVKDDGSGFRRLKLQQRVFRKKKDKEGNPQYIKPFATGQELEDLRIKHGDLANLKCDVADGFNDLDPLAVVEFARQFRNAEYVPITWHDHHRREIKQDSRGNSLFAPPAMFKSMINAGCVVGGLRMAFGVTWINGDTITVKPRFDYTAQGIYMARAPKKEKVVMQSYDNIDGPGLGEWDPDDSDNEDENMGETGDKYSTGSSGYVH